MSKKILCFAVGALFITLCLPAYAQQPKLHRIGVIMPGEALSTTIDGLRQGLKDLGLQEGKQYTLTIKDTQGEVKAATQAAKTLEQEKVDMIYALTIPAAAAAKESTAKIPIVFSVGSDPVAGGLVDSFAKPGGRLTGVHYLVKDLTAKRLELLKEILPKLSRVIIFYDPGERVSAESAELARQEAKRLGLRFVEQHATSVDQLRSALQALKAGEADAYFYTPTTTVLSQAQLVIDTAKAKKLPTMFQDQSLVERGALASYGQNYREIGRLSAKYVQRVLSGTLPGDLKIETVDNVELAINLQTAKQLGVSIPPQLLARAKKVFK